jgi:hypothetical protein
MGIVASDYLLLQRGFLNKTAGTLLPQFETMGFRGRFAM